MNTICIGKDRHSNPVIINCRSRNAALCGNIIKNVSYVHENEFLSIFFYIYRDMYIYISFFTYVTGNTQL